MFCNSNQTRLLNLSLELEWLFRSEYQRINHDQLKAAFESLTDDQKYVYGVMAERNRDRAAHLWNDACDVLLRTNGGITYSNMANNLNNLVTPKTLSSKFNRHPDFYMRHPKFLPLLDSSRRKSRTK